MRRAKGVFGTLSLSASTARLLRPDAGMLEPPICSVLFGAARFSAHGRSLAVAQEVAAPGESQRSFFPRLKENLRVLRDARAVLEEHGRKGHHLAPAAGWLIDHGHLLDGQLDTVRSGLPRRYYEKLPRLRDAPLAGLPRVYGLAWAWVAHTDSGMDEDLLGQFLAAYQSERELTLAELWAIPTTLRVVLIENLRRLAERAATKQAARDLAHRWVETATVAGDDELLDGIGQRLAERGVLEPFALQLYNRSGDVATHVQPTLRLWLARHLPDPASALQRQQQQAAEDHQSVRNAVTSLRALDRTDWRSVLLKPSAALAPLQALPAFTAESETTQDQTLQAVERLARRAHMPESRISATVAQLAAGATGAASAPLHWLRGAGRPALLRALGRSDAWARCRPALRRARTPAYLFTWVAASVALVGILMQHDSTAELSTLSWLLTALLLALPASEAVLALLHRVISESLPPRRLPRLALESGIPIEQRPLVVVPALLTDIAAVQALAAQIEQHHLANPEPHAQFALLTDFADAAQEQMPGDDALMQATREAVEALNQRHGATACGHPRFLLLHRPRQWCDSEQCWMGWERKRGKLEALLVWLVEGDRSPGSSPFVDVGALSAPAPGICHLVTLDSDTDMPPGRLRELVAVAAHPLNTPVVDAASHRVLQGYTILQPRVVVPLPAAQARTAYHWLFSGQWGVDPYSAASSEVYHDAFGEGSFVGKGLLHVRGAHATLAHRLPEGQVLSHDLLEGSLGRCATVTDITLVEDAPAHPDVAASRLHRWTRGDWQLLPFVLHPRRWPMAGINRWKLLDNLRRSLVAPAALALVLWTLASAALPMGSVLGLLAAAWGAGPLLGAVAALAPPRDDISLRLFYRHAMPRLLRAVAGALWHGIQLVEQARLSADAMVRALFRQFVSRRRLLQWTTAAAAQAKAATTWPALWRRHWKSTALALTLLVLLLALRWLSDDIPARVPLAWPIALCLLWAAAPLFTGLAARAMPAPAQRLDDGGRARVRDLARDTWTFFERNVGADDHHLPPDNVQFTGPEPMVAHRTSPTNMGLYLLSVMAARELALISDATAVQRLQATLDTMQALPRWRGHFYNWYGTQTLAVLLPAYVSAVDSGNLSGHLLVLASACEQRAAALGEASPPAAELAAQLQRLARQAQALALAPDFKALYDPRRRLLHIGYDVDQQRLDLGHYDLLASEARLASLVAIAKGDVPPQHWSALGRPLFAALHGPGRGSVGLKSWSGSMFEYLMPSLVLDEPEGSLLLDATRTAVALQRLEGLRRGTPWGVSESAIAAQDHTLAYQYGPHGVAALALRRTPADERVVAPYASVMALLVAPQAAADNLAALEKLGARGEFGFIEALDYTPHRQPTGTRGAFTPVLTVMAHHQAMGLLACTHVLTAGAVHGWAGASPHLRAVRPLLHEVASHEAPLPRDTPAMPPRPALPSQRWQWSVDAREAALPPSHVLGNDRYAVVLAAGGSGSSQWQGQSLTRWRDDVLRQAHGLFGYVVLTPGAPWSALSASPGSVTSTRDRYQTEFHPDRVLLHARIGDLEATTTVAVSTVDDCELRRIELHNPGRRPMRLRVALAMEPTLTLQRADEAHPAFSNLFLQAHWSPSERSLYMRRRPRLPDEDVVHAALALVACDDPSAQVHAVTDRALWLGRLGTTAQPLPAAGVPPPEAPPQPVQAAAGGLPPDSVEMPTGLDPVAVLIVDLTVPARGSRHLCFVLGAANDEAALGALVDRWQQPSSAERALELSDTLARIRLRELHLEPETWAGWLYLNTLLVSSVTRPLPVMASGTAIDRRVLWRFGIGGERPILALWIDHSEGLDLARQLITMLRLWSAAAHPVDLVIVNSEAASYDAPVQRALGAMQELATLRIDSQRPASSQAALVVLPLRELAPVEQATLRLIARVSLQADGRSLAQQINRLRAMHDEDAAARRAMPRARLAWPVVRPGALPPQGQFDSQDAAFRFEVSDTQQPPRPWINVLANPDFGCIVSEAGGGSTWAGNSRMHQLTAGSNDALCDTPVEALWLHDLDSDQVWWLGRGAQRREVVHGIGSTHMHLSVDGLLVELDWCVDVEAAVKHLRVRVALSAGTSPGMLRRVRLVGFAEWTLGASRGDRATVLTRPFRWLADPSRLTGDQGVGLAVLATQADASAGRGGATAFLTWRPGDDDGANAGSADLPGGGTSAAWLELDDWTSDRREFFDEAGRWVLPVSLGARAGAGLDACAAIGCRLRVTAGRPAQATLLLGHAATPEDAGRLAKAACSLAPSQRLARQLAQWPALFDRITVRSPDPAFDALVNRWLPYQAVACRIWARAGFYQAGGAFGFRDQLQDAMNLAARAPDLLQRQVRLHAARQFGEGDVQHWWHPPGGAGVRTHISDDLLWLPLALATSVQHEGDSALLDEQQPFLQGAAVPEGREDVYETPAVSEETASLYEHGARAVDRSVASIARGAHGLPTMGTGDWNDGMNRVGHQGRGESVWLAWFLCHVIDAYAPLAQARGESARAQGWRDARAALTVALDGAGWDGAWYRRAFFDDGSPLGSASNQECRIDLIAQAWSVLAGGARADRALQAMRSAHAQLWDPAAGVMRLLHPPLAEAVPGAGYIQAYPRGIRENGGQYNHSVVWALMACAQQGDAQGAWRLFEAMSPAHRSAHRTRGPAYGLEPYVMAGDIYSQAPYAGRGGWSWYTGAASWLQRAAIESICGLQWHGSRVTVRPCLPPHWPGVELRLRHAGRTVRVSVTRGAQPARPGHDADGMPIALPPGQSIDLDDLPATAWLAVDATAPSGSRATAVAGDPATRDAGSDGP